MNPMANPIAVDSPSAVSSLPTNSSAVRRLRERSEFDAVYAEHFPALCRLGALLTGDAQEGQDLAQEAFARWYARRHMVGDPPAYMRTAVINQVRGGIRKAIVRRRAKPLLDAEAALPVIQESSHLADVILRLPERQRAAIVLRYFEGRSEAEIARILECRPGTVKSLLFRALTELRRVVER
jgi:RNA polymerase sigma factor (sigma-70 family)